MLPLHHTPIIFQRPCTDDWVRTNDLQNMSLLLLPTELHQYLEQSKGIEPSLFLLGREMPYHQANSALCGQGGTRTPLLQGQYDNLCSDWIYSPAPLPAHITPLWYPTESGVEPFSQVIRKPSQGEPHNRLALYCRISWNRTKFLWVLLPASSVSPQTFILTERIYLHFNPILNVVSASVCLQHSHMRTSQCVCITS